MKTDQLFLDKKQRISIIPTMSEKVKIIGLSAFFTALTIFGVYKVWWGGNHVPKEFLRARIEGAQVAEKIVNLVSLSLINLQEVAKLEEKLKHGEAINIISQELARNDEARKEAVKLSNYLDQMAKTMEDVRPPEARNYATEAVGQEIQLINRLISYNDNLRNLFELLKAKFEGKIKDGDARLQQLLLLINQETNAINNLNQRYNAAMAKFDELTIRK